MTTEKQNTISPILCRHSPPKLTEDEVRVVKSALRYKSRALLKTTRESVRKSEEMIVLALGWLLSSQQTTEPECQWCGTPGNYACADCLNVATEAERGIISSEVVVPNVNRDENDSPEQKETCDEDRFDTEACEGKRHKRARRRRGYLKRDRPDTEDGLGRA